MICETLARYGITTALVEDVRSAILNLKSDVSSIVLLDMDLEGADLFLDSIITNFYNPPPYLLAATESFSSTTRTDILNRGADVCLEKPIDALYLLASHPEMVFSQGQIYSHVWNEDYGFATTSVSDLISSIRKKLGLTIKDKRYIQTLYNAGYRFVAE